MRHLKADGGREDRMRRSLLATLLSAVAFGWASPARAVKR
jgi:hypothetical protein